jgi:hypothetical protein
MTFELDFVFEPTESGVRVIQSFELKPIFLLAIPVAVMWMLFMRRRAVAGIEETHANAKRILEAAG